MTFANCTLCALHIHWHPDKLLEFHICSVCLYCILYVWYICIFWVTAWQVKKNPRWNQPFKKWDHQSMVFCWHANQVILIIRIHAPFRFKKSLSQTVLHLWFLSKASLIIVRPSVTHKVSAVVRLFWCDPGMWRSCNLSKSLATSPCLTLQNFAKPNQLLKLGPNFEAEVLSRFWSWSFVKILELSPALTAETSCCQL